MKPVRLILYILVFGLQLCIPAQVYADQENWERFKARFISEDGRVIDTGNGHISHSEGQGTGMLLAVAHDDRETFEKIWRWTDKNLGLRDDGLFVWRWVPDVDLHTSDLGSASDGDIFIAWAILRAAHKWDSPEYLGIAERLVKTIRTNLVATVYGDTLLLPGPVWPRKDSYTIINLSYWIYPAFREFSEVDATPVWEKLIRTGMSLMQRAQFGKWDLPADWFAVKNDGSLSQLDDFPYKFGYEAVRIPLYYLWGGYTDKDILRIYQAFWSSTAKGNKLVTILGLALDSVIQQENVLAFRAVNELVECGISQEPVSILGKSFSDYEDYYSAALFLIAQLAIEESMPYCRAMDEGEVRQAMCTKVGDPDCPISDPIHAKIEKGDITVMVEDFIQIPPTSMRRPLTRINTLTHANDGSGRLFVIDEDGKIYLVKKGKLQLEPFLDIARIRGNHFYSDNEETGIRSIAFHPDFSTPDTPGYLRFYTLHSERTDSTGVTTDSLIYQSPSEEVNHYDVISEWMVDSGDQDKVLLSSQRELLRVAQPQYYDNVGYIGFNPTVNKGDPEFGLLYIGIGDGGNRYSATAQKKSNIFGKIIRFDPLSVFNKKNIATRDKTSITNDNKLSVKTWASGFRKPWQFSWDKESGLMFIVDAARQSAEEVNIGKPGANYGWDHREGSFSVKFNDMDNVYPLPANDDSLGFEYPVLQYDTDEGISISGGFVYRGRSIPGLYGHYVFGDLINGRIFHADIDSLPMDETDMSGDVSGTIRELRLFYKGAEKSMLEILNYDSRADLNLGMDEDGEIYLLTKRDGMVRKLMPLEGDLQP